MQREANHHRILLAAAVAPVVGLLALAMGLALAFRKPDESILQALDGATFAAGMMAVFGLLPAYILESVACTVGLRWLEGRQRLTVTWVVGLAAVLGAIAFVPWVLALRLPDSGFEALLILGFGLGAGAVAGATFWVVGLAASRQQAERPEG